jgi:hypothetical protein
MKKCYKNYRKQEKKSPSCIYIIREFVSQAVYRVVKNNRR